MYFQSLNVTQRVGTRTSVDFLCHTKLVETVNPKNDAVGRGNRPVPSDSRIRALPRSAVGQEFTGADGSPAAFSWWTTPLSIPQAKFCHPETIRQSGQNRRSANLRGR